MSNPEEAQEQAQFDINQTLKKHGAFLWWDNTTEQIKIALGEVGSEYDTPLYGELK